MKKNRLKLTSGLFTLSLYRSFLSLSQKRNNYEVTYNYSRRRNQNYVVHEVYELEKLVSFTHYCGQYYLKANLALTYLLYILVKTHWLRSLNFYIQNQEYNSLSRKIFKGYFIKTWLIDKQKERSFRKMWNETTILTHNKCLLWIFVPWLHWIKILVKLRRWRTLIITNIWYREDIQIKHF